MKTSGIRFHNVCRWKSHSEPPSTLSRLSHFSRVSLTLLVFSATLAPSLLRAATLTLNPYSDGTVKTTEVNYSAASERIGRGGDPPGIETNAFYVFRMPSSQPSYRVFTGASFAFQYFNKTSSLTFNVDLWGAGISTSPSISTSYFRNTNTGSGTKLNDNILTPSTSFGRRSSSGTALINYIDQDIGTGRFVKLRLNHDQPATINYRGYSVAFEEHTSYADPALSLTYYDPAASITNPSFGNVLVGNSKSAGLDIENSSHVQTYLTGSNAPLTSSSGDFTRISSGSFSIRGGSSRSYTYSFAPDSRGNSSETRSFNTNIGTQSATFAGKGVAPVSSLNQSNSDAGYVLVGTTGNASITIGNVGDGNDSGAGSVSNLSGSVSNGSGGFSLIGSNSINLADDGARTFTYNYSPTSRGSASQSLTASFTNGSQNNTNQAHNLNYTLDAQGVAPLYEKTSTTGTGPTRVGTTGTATVRVTNKGDGNLSGVSGATSNLNGDALAATGLFSAASTSISLGDDAFQDISFEYTPTVRSASDSQVVNLSFSNGSSNGQNDSFTDTATLTGSAVGPVFESSRPVGGTFDLGQPAGGNVTDPLSFSLFNNTTDTGVDSLVGLTLLSAEFTGPDAANFSLRGFTPGTVLSPSDELMLDVIFANDQVIGEKSAMLTFTTDQNTAFGAAGNTFSFFFSASIPVPEPASGWLLMMGMFFLRRRQGGETSFT